MPHVFPQNESLRKLQVREADSHLRATFQTKRPDGVYHSQYRLVNENKDRTASNLNNLNDMNHRPGVAEIRIQALKSHVQK